VDALAVRVWPRELDGFRGASSAGVLPVWIKPVVAQASGVPGLYGRIGAWVRPRSAPHAEPTGGSLRRRRDPTPWVTVSSATFARSSVIVTAFARWPDLADEQVGGWRDDAGSLGAHRQHDLVVLESRTCRMR
jgi:hypothetical protein